MTDPRFTPTVISAAQTSHAKFWPYGPFVSITLAQWALESAYGAHTSGTNNYFGIMPNAAQIAAGQFTERWSKEFIDGQYVPRYERFANYPDLAAGFDAHAQLLISHHYLPCVRARTPAEYATALHTCGYATAPNYPSVLMSIITHNNLTNFDQTGPQAAGKITCNGAV